MGLFSRKKNASIIETGTALLSFTQMHLDNDETLGKIEEDKIDIVKNEIFYLNVFTIDVAVGQTLDDRLTNEILAVFYTHLQEALGKNFLEALKIRFDSYLEAVNTTHHLGPSWNIGKEFSVFCGYDLDLNMTTTGSIIYGATYKGVSDFLKSLKIV